MREGGGKSGYFSIVVGIVGVWGVVCLGEVGLCNGLGSVAVVDGRGVATGGENEAVASEG